MIVLTLYSAIAVAIYWYLQHVIFRSKKRGIWDIHRLPFPPASHWFWGHEKEALYGGNYGEAYSRWIDEMGGIVRTRAALWYPDILVVADPLALSHVEIKNAYNFVKSPMIRPIVERILGRSLAWVEGDEHRKMRTALAPCFSTQRVRQSENVVLDTAHKLVNTLRDHISQSGHLDGGSCSSIVNIMEWTSKATLDIIGRMGFDYDFLLGESPEAQDIFRLWRKQVVLGMTLTGFVAPRVLRAFPFIVSLPFGNMQAQGEIKLRIREIGKEIVKKKIIQLRESQEGIVDDDLLGYLVQMGRERDGNVSIDEILDHITTFIMVGQETTAGVLSYTIHALAQHTNVQEELRTELEAFGREPTYDDLQSKEQLSLLDAVTKEGMRLFPSGAHTERVSVEDDIIPLSKPIRATDGSYLSSIRISKGQIVAIPRLSLNTRCGLWGSDGMVFKPSRWFETSKDALPRATNSGWNNLDTFSEGAHMCLGYRLAVFEFKMILCILLRTFKFERVEGVKILNKFAATLQPKVMENNGDGKHIVMDGPWLPVKVSLV